MQNFKQLILKHPAQATLFFAFLATGSLFLLKVFGGQHEGLFDWPRLLLVNSISAGVIFLLYKLDWLEGAGLSVNPSKEYRNWFWKALPLLAIALLILTSAQWSQLEVTPLRVIAWLVSNISTGVFEEVLLRGLCFYILYRAWGATRSGLFYAAIFQAVVFGVAHLGNLYINPAIDVIAQVIFATLIGIGFAGLVYITKSLWPAIIVHTCINSAGSINLHFIPNLPADGGPGVSGYVVIILVFFVLSTLPGLIYLRKAELQAA